MSLHPRTLPAGFISPCLPINAPQPPCGEEWVHEIKHDGFRVIARKEGKRVKLYSRPGNDLTYRFPLIVEALAGLRARSCIIDGEAVACSDDGIASFERIRYRRHDGGVFLFALDLLELDGEDMRRDPLGRRRSGACSGGRRRGCGSTSTSTTRTARSSSFTPARWALRASCRSEGTRTIARGVRRTGARGRTRPRPRGGGARV